MKFLKIKGACQHNLKNISLTLPKNKIIVFTGVSGSGKSSLAFDTIYAEGQRRYVESLSPYARQFLGIMDKPEVESIEGLSPSIAIDQKSASHNPRSTVGTITEVYDYLRLLYARVGHPHCPMCRREIKRMSSQEIFETIKERYQKPRSKRGHRLMILAPLVKDRKGEYQRLFTNLRTNGYQQARVDGQVINLAEPPTLIKTNRHTIEVVVARLIVQRTTDWSRLSEAVESALHLSQGQLIVSEVGDSSFVFPKLPKQMKDTLYSERFACAHCNLALPEIEPRTFSFNSPHGACPSCSGLGTQLRVDPELVLAPELTLSEGAIIPLARALSRDTWFTRTLAQVGREHGFSLTEPLKNFSREQLDIILNGTGSRIYRIHGKNRFGRPTVIHETYPGVISILQDRHQQLESSHRKAEIERFMRVEVCPTCAGKRLKSESLAVTVGGQNIATVCALTIDQSKQWVQDLNQNLSVKEKEIAVLIIKELLTRLSFLVSVGLEYLTLDRPASTLAGGERQRIRLASQVGSGLAGVLYVLDEPSVGLHYRDQARLMNTLKSLRDLGNTVIIVEHDPETIKAADWIVDFGPGAGQAGGEIVAEGTLKEIMASTNSITGKYLSGKRKISIANHPRQENQAQLELRGVTHHNLKNINVTFPLGKLICVTGVSGSGKSSLIDEVLFRALAAKFYHRKEKPGPYTKLLGTEHLDKVILVDQSPIGRTPRSNPATYTGVYTPIRELFASTKEARIRGYRPGRFSFNVKGGRCEACQGQGQLKIEMQFLADVYITCEVCQGKRYNQNTLEIEYRGHNIADVLDLTVNQALDLFDKIPQIKNKLKTLKEVGLGYIKLGQAAPTLSGGEAQRVKLATELTKKQTGRTLYLLDEPTTGLHFVDLEKLLNVLGKLVSYGNTVIVIEHNLEVIKNADWIIDLGPEGGERGGEVVVTGPPDQVALNQASHTGRALAKILK